MENHPFVCQLYSYDADAYMLTRNSPEHYAEHFPTSREQLDEKVDWLNFHSITDRPHIEKLCERLSIDKLTIEDIYKDFKRPKLEEYNTYLFFKIKSALPNDNSQYLEKENISFILGQNYLISFQEKSSDHFPEVRDRIEQKRGKIRIKGEDFLLFRLLEAITDNYFEVLDAIVASISKLESGLISHPKNDTLKRIEIQKRKLIELRKIVFPLKEITSQLEKMHCPFIERENHYYFSELKDNCLTILDEIDANKQILEGMANLYYAIQGQRMNEIMKVLTIVSTIFIPLTFIVGVYGMNFKHMPELETKYGYYITWGVMVLIAVLLMLYFYNRGWLKKPDIDNGNGKHKNKI